MAERRSLAPNVLLAMATLLCGCTTLSYLKPLSPAQRECPGQLRSPAEIDGDFQMRERVRIAEGGRSEPIDLIVEKRGDRIVMIGLSPIGAKLFSLVQRDSDVEQAGLPTRALPVSPLSLARALHSARFAAATPDNAVEHAEGFTRVRNLACGTEFHFETVSRRDLAPPTERGSDASRPAPRSPQGSPDAFSSLASKRLPRHGKPAVSHE